MVVFYVRFPLSLRNVEDILRERGIDVSHETLRFWWSRFGPIFAKQIRRERTGRAHSNWKWYLDKIFMKINGTTYSLWRALDEECEVPKSCVVSSRDRRAACKFLRESMKQ